jgi:DNA-binding MarR family transcriptional regulator
MNSYRKDIRELMVAVNVIDGIYEMVAKKIGIKINTLALLYALDDGQPHSQKEICEEWLIPPTTLNTIVKENIAAGYLYLHTDTGKKEKEICLTDKGAAFAQTILNQVYNIENSAMEQTLQTVSRDFVQSLNLFNCHLKEEARKFSHESEYSV